MRVRGPGFSLQGLEYTFRLVFTAGLHASVVQLINLSPSAQADESGRWACELRGRAATGQGFPLEPRKAACRWPTSFDLSPIRSSPTGEEPPVMLTRVRSTWRPRGLSKSVISRVLIRVTPFRVLITLLIAHLLSPLSLQVGIMK